MNELFFSALIGLLLFFSQGCALGPAVPGDTMVDHSLSWKIRDALWKLEYRDGVRSLALPEITKTQVISQGTTQIEELWVVNRSGTAINYVVTVIPDAAGAEPRFQIERVNHELTER